DIFRGGAISTERGERIHLVADRHVRDAVRHALDDARHLMSRYRGQALRPVAIPVGLRIGQLCRRNTRCVNSAKGGPSAQLCLARILVHQLLRTDFSMESNGFHGGSLADCTSISECSASCLSHAFEMLVGRSWLSRLVIFARIDKGPAA